MNPAPLFGGDDKIPARRFGRDSAVAVYARRRLLAVSAVLTLLVAMLFPLPCAAQTAGTDEAEKEPTSDAPSDAPAGEDSEDRGNLLRVNGKVFLLAPLGLDETQVRDDLLQRLQTQKDVPGFQVSEIDATGSVTGELAQLRLTLTVVVNRENEWVPVPVGFPEWQVKEFEADAEGDRTEAVFGGNAAAQRRWYLRGKGEHVLTMVLLGEVRTTQADRQRLRMSVPDAVISHLQLSFDRPIDDVQGNAEQRRVRVEASDSGTDVELWGLNEQTEITWVSATPGEKESIVIQAPQPADMVLDLTTSPASLSCIQTLSISGGTVDELSVALPQGFSELNVTGTDEDGKSIVESDEYSSGESGLTARIRFTEPVRGRITLNYQLGMTTTEFPQEITVSVPDVDGVSTESADVEIQRPPGLGLESTPVHFARRKRVESQTDARFVATAWELISAESRLQLSVSENPAYYAVDPEIEIATEGSSLKLRARFPVKVIHGSLNGLPITWGGFAESGWQIVKGSVELAQGDVTTPLQADTSSPESERSDAIALTFPDRESGEFLVEFEARLSLADLSSADGRLTLPDVASPTSHLTTVLLVDSDTYSLTLDESPGISRRNRPSTDTGATSVGVLSVKAWQVDQPDSTVRVKLTPQTPVVSSRVVVSIESERDSLHVREQIDVDVRHRDLTELTLLIPDSVFPTIRLAGSDEKLALTALGGRTTCALPESMRGRVRVVVDYLWNPPTDRSGPVMLPLALPIDGLESVTVGTNEPQSVIIAGDDGLRPVWSSEFAAAWITQELRQQIPVKLSSGFSDPQSAVPVISLVQTVLGASGVTSTTTVVFDQSPGEVLFQVPENSGLVAAAVNGEPVSEVSAGPLESVGVWRIRVPESAGNDVVRVSVTARSPRGPHHHLLSQISVESPRVVGTPDWLTTVWLVNAGHGARVFPAENGAWLVTSPSFLNGWTADTSAAAAQTIDVLLSGTSDSVRTTVQREVSAALSGRQSRAVCFTTGSRGVVRLMEYSSSAGWMFSAVIGILGFVMLLRLRTWGRTAACLFVVAAIVAWGLLPEFSLSLADLVVPGIAGALLAYTIQQIAGPVHRRRPRRRPSRSIFSGRSRSTSGRGQLSVTSPSSISVGSATAP